jgi:endogenous inhibitor of DNA gyrase (YacG/DUF329 family)
MYPEMLVSISCPNCNNLFLVDKNKLEKGKARKFCTQTCAMTLWHKNAKVEYLKKRQEYFDSITIKKECEECHKQFSTRNKDQRFCTQLCSVNFFNKSRRAAIIERTCEQCGKTFTTKNTKHRKDARFCSKSCAGIFVEAQRIEDKICPKCLKHFSGNTHRKYCCKECELDYTSIATDKQCLNCGKQVVVRGSNLKEREETQQYCSVKCHMIYAHKNGLLNCIVSKAENEIADFLRSFDVRVIQSYRPSFLEGKELDIFLPEHNIAIEYNGLLWHSESFGNRDKNYHLYKSQTCLENSIRLIHIFSDEWADKQEIVKNRLKNILSIKKDQEKIYARNCEIRKIDHKTLSEFLKNNHLQGSITASVKLGAFYRDVLVSVMSFGSMRRALGSSSIAGTYELTRFASIQSIPGIFSKFISHFVKEHSPEKIISYLDLRWNFDAGHNVYVKNGFSFVSRSIPNYWYTKDYNIREYRFQYQKSNLVKAGFDPSLSEREIMQQRGYDRIWDCGTAKFAIEF